ncbi:MAG: hypothetical protein CM1200mP16_16300 [Nitrospina sp.]|nr:MAG: hypothetical protein CM1200mP16_16300 [Nitrospina sp.]
MNAAIDKGKKKLILMTIFFWAREKTGMVKPKINRHRDSFSSIKYFDNYVDAERNFRKGAISVFPN